MSHDWEKLKEIISSGNYVGAKVPAKAEDTPLKVDMGYVIEPKVKDKLCLVCHKKVPVDAPVIPWSLVDNALSQLWQDAKHFKWRENE